MLGPCWHGEREYNYDRFTRLRERTFGSIPGSHDSIRMNIYVAPRSSFIGQQLTSSNIHGVAAAPWPARYEWEVKASYSALGGQSNDP